MMMLIACGNVTTLSNARDMIENRLTMDHNDVSLFESTIRILGGSLTSYYLANDKTYLTTAQQVIINVMKNSNLVLLGKCTFTERTTSIGGRIDIEYKSFLNVFLHSGKQL